MTKEKQTKSSAEKTKQTAEKPKQAKLESKHEKESSKLSAPEKSVRQTKQSSHPALKEFFYSTIQKKLMKDLGYTNIMQVPRITKITLNMGVGEAVNDKKIVENAAAELSRIAGQKSVITKTRKSVAGFKIREGWPIGCKVTLRKDRMFEFLERLLYIAIPRIRDFRGLNRRSFDGRGNYSMGIKEQIVFPEIQYDKIDALRGLDITITTTAKTNEEGLALLSAYRFPFKE